jgi:molybdate transport system permease protein
MPLAIYAALESDPDAAIALSVVLLAIAGLVLLVFRRWLRLASERVA